jgi:hypothetical protein
MAIPRNEAPLLAALSCVAWRLASGLESLIEFL